ncbi:MAG: hypothetical protein RLZ44_52 [Pseudomonadota bacterium]
MRCRCRPSRAVERGFHAAGPRHQTRLIGPSLDDDNCESSPARSSVTLRISGRRRRAVQTMPGSIATAAKVELPRTEPKAIGFRTDDPGHRAGVFVGCVEVGKRAGTESHPQIEMRLFSITCAHVLAERVGFEPTDGINRRRFSRPLHSTALPPLQAVRKHTQFPIENKGKQRHLRKGCSLNFVRYSSRN